MNAKNSPTSAGQTLNPWPIAIISFFGLAIVGIAGFIVFAARNQMDLVRPDYYDEEIRYQEQLDRANRTRSVKARVAIVYDAVHQCVTLTLPGDHASRRTTGKIHFYRPSDARLDKQVQLAIDRDGVQRMDTGSFQAGLWRVRVYWTVDDQEYYFNESIIVHPRKT